MTEAAIADLFLFLIAAGLVVPIAKRLRINPIIGFLLVGLLVGPHGLAQLPVAWPWLEYVSIQEIDGIAVLAELGVIFLLFMVALELSTQRLLEMRWQVFGLGSAQVLVTGALICGIALAYGNSLASALVLGGCLALSSTAIVSQHLLDHDELGSRFGQATLGILLAQDLAVVPILFLVGALGSSAETGLGTSLALAIGQALVAIAVILLIGRLVVRPLFRFINVDHSSEVVMAMTLLIITITATATHSAGLSAALGAFLVGLILAESEFRHEIELIIEPLKGLLLGLFFMSVAMSVNIAAVSDKLGLILLSVIGLIALKALVTGILARCFGSNASDSLATGLTLAQGGEFAFVVVAAAVAARLLEPEVAQFMLVVVGASMLLTPPLIHLAGWLALKMTSRGIAPAPEATNAPLSGHVILVGYGRTGKMLAQLLTDQKAAFVALDLDPARVSFHQAQNVPIYLGDASRRAMLQRVAVDTAAAVVLCTDNHRASERVLGAIRDAAPDVPVLMRVHSSLEASQFVALGAAVAVPEVLESGLHLAEELFSRLDIDEQAYSATLAEYRRVETSG
ncbi:MAG: cation:proton antiporter [Pseudomonadales bacterium]